MTRLRSARHVLLFFAACLFVCLAAAPMPKLSADPEDRPMTSVEEAMVETTKTEIEAVLGNASIPWRERRRRIDKILDLLPPALFGRLPLPAQMYRLPDDVLQRIKNVHMNPKLTVREKRQQIRHLMENLTIKQRTAFEEEPFPDRPPAGFEEILDAQTMEELMAIHDNETLSIAEKKVAIDGIMRAVPKDVVERLPLPILMRQLPEEIQKRLHDILYDFDRPWDARFRAARKFVRTLPKQFRRLLRPSKGSSGYDSNDQKDAQDKSSPSFLPYASDNGDRFNGPIVDDIKPKVLSSLGFTITPVIRRRSTFYFY